MKVETRREPLPDLDLAVARFAIYYAPPAGSCWWNEGSRWLGRDAITGRHLNPPHVPRLSRALHELTVEPRRYGLHGTLKAPMRLAPEASVDDLLAIAATVAARHAPFDLTVQADVIDTDNDKRPGFVALRPKAVDSANAAMQSLAADCVQAFDALRAPPSDAELARRQAQTLSSRQRELLAQWGYPFVLDEFRFHVTLSDRVDAPDASAMIEWWQPRAQALGAMRIDALALFVQPAPGEPFVLVERFGFGEGA
ncbi:DUF1045 domain-containing protein [Pandoraea pulmonicola]|uniref:Phosphonate metabolism protein n=1 Tax=Pandoraea pulmonicola TaxID=93221 RepID=A0AAJ5D0F3_PANPU|nr:DUF1045 domain-containing protein [Pandoraea pulmonicola]AJC23255.2 hypothetical protein RO07_11340 [Pandoraea pulmonicola]SUA90500.1 putative phosphonate metabolism protein [Pandoraea pulmonicola]